MWFINPLLTHCLGNFPLVNLSRGLAAYLALILSSISFPNFFSQPFPNIYLHLYFVLSSIHISQRASVSFEISYCLGIFLVLWFGGFPLHHGFLAVMSQQDELVEALSAETNKLRFSGKLLADRSINKNALKAIILKAWRTSRGVQTVDLRENVFLFKSACEGDKRKCVELGPWNIEGYWVYLFTINRECSYHVT